MLIENFSFREIKTLGGGMYAILEVEVIVGIAEERSVVVHSVPGLAQFELPAVRAGNNQRSAIHG